MSSNTLGPFAYHGARLRGLDLNKYECISDLENPEIGNINRERACRFLRANFFSQILRAGRGSHSASQARLCSFQIHLPPRQSNCGVARGSASQIAALFYFRATSKDRREQSRRTMEPGNIRSGDSYGACVKSARMTGAVWEATTELCM